MKAVISIVIMLLFERHKTIIIENHYEDVSQWSKFNKKVRFNKQI